MTRACVTYTQSIRDIICYGHLQCILNWNPKHAQKWKKWPRVALSQETFCVQIFVRLITIAIATNSTKNSDKWCYSASTRMMLLLSFALNIFHTHYIAFEYTNTNAQQNSIAQHCIDMKIILLQYVGSE